MSILSFDESGRWPNPDELRHGFIGERRAEREQLVSAGLTVAEVDRAIELLDVSPIRRVAGSPGWLMRASGGKDRGPTGRRPAQPYSAWHSQMLGMPTVKPAFW